MSWAQLGVLLVVALWAIGLMVEYALEVLVKHLSEIQEEVSGLREAVEDIRQNLPG